jgi:hypothetical protein
MFSKAEPFGLILCAKPAGALPQTENPLNQHFSEGKMKRKVCFGAIVILILVLLSGSSAFAQDKQGMAWDDRPERGISASLKYPGISITPGEKLRVDLMIKVTGKSDEMVMARVLEAPPDWDASIKYLGNIITGIHMNAADYSSLELVAEPKDKKKAEPGAYKFVVEVMAQDGQFKQTSGIDVTVIAEEKAGKELDLTTSYPVLRGATGSTFEFSLDIKNNNAKDQLVQSDSPGPPAVGPSPSSLPMRTSRSLL